VPEEGTDEARRWLTTQPVSEGTIKDKLATRSETTDEPLFSDLERLLLDYARR